MHKFFSFSPFLWWVLQFLNCTKLISKDHRKDLSVIHTIEFVPKKEGQIYLKWWKLCILQWFWKFFLCWIGHTFCCSTSLSKSGIILFIVLNGSVVESFWTNWIAYFFFRTLCNFEFCPILSSMRNSEFVTLCDPFVNWWCIRRLW